MKKLAAAIARLGFQRFDDRSELFRVYCRAVENQIREFADHFARAHARQHVLRVRRRERGGCVVLKNKAQEIS